MRSLKEIIKKLDDMKNPGITNIDYSREISILEWLISGDECNVDHDLLSDGWRDARKDPPDDRRDVIIGNANNKCVSVGWWNDEHNNGEGKWLIRTVHFDGDVTHWKELPDPPAFA